MSRLDDIFKSEVPEAYASHGFKNTKQAIKALMLDLIDGTLDHGKWVGGIRLLDEADLRQKVEAL